MKKRAGIIGVVAILILVVGYGVIRTAPALTPDPSPSHFSLLNNTHTTMNSTTLVLKNGETKTVDGLTITNLEDDRGHKIMADGGGDNSFASLRLESEGAETQQMRIHNPLSGEENSPIVYGTYTILVQKVQWDGEHVELLVTTE